MTTISDYLEDVRQLDEGRIYSYYRDMSRATMTTTQVDQKAIQDEPERRLQLDEELRQLWPGCKVAIERDTLEVDKYVAARDEIRPDFAPIWLLFPLHLAIFPGTKYAKYLKEITIWHEDSALVVRYSYNPQTLEPDIKLAGLAGVANRDIQRLLPVVEYLRQAGRHRPLTEEYDLAYATIQEGVDEETMRQLFLARYEISQPAFDQAMYRRRLGKMREPAVNEGEYILTLR